MAESLKAFGNYYAALKWAKTHAHEECYAHHFWRVEKIENAGEAYAIAVRSRNSGELHHYASGG